MTGCGSQTGYSVVTKKLLGGCQRAHQAMSARGLYRIRMGAKANRLSAPRPKEYETPWRGRTQLQCLPFPLHTRFIFL